MISRLKNLPAPRQPTTPPALEQPARNTPRKPVQGPAVDSSQGASRATAVTAAPRNTDGLLTYGELSAGQRALLGPKGAETYGRLSTDQRGVFLLLTRRMERAGADFSGLRLKDPETTLRRNRMLFDNNPQGLARLRSSLEAGIQKGKFTQSPVFAPFHKGMSDWGVRENRQKWAMQLGIGPAGAFVDVDRYNPNAGIIGKIGHLGEIVTPGKPSPLQIAAELGEDLRTRLPAQKARPAA